MISQCATSDLNRLLRIMTKLFCAALFATTIWAQAQTLTVLHNFTGGADGASPYAGLTIDAAGNLYGTANSGGYTGGYCGSGCGTVFKLTHHGSGWTFTPLYAFKGDSGLNNDPANPGARVVFGPDGNLYGTTVTGGGGRCNSFGGYGCGAVFKLSPPATVCKAAFCPWTDTVLYSAAHDNGEEPRGDVVFDSAGNLYSTVALGGQYEGGYVFELTPYHGGWTEQIVYAFNPDLGDCNNPMAGLVFDASGNLYGTANTGCGYGGVYQLVPSGSGWTENILLSLNGFGNGDGIEASLTPDGHGSFYGTTVGLGPNNGGTIFELTPSNGSWMYSLVHAFGGGGDGSYPTAPVTLDASGTHMYGTTGDDGPLGIGDGTVYQLTLSNGTWTESLLHYFEGTDGKYPASGVVLDANGNLYGTTSSGGAYGYGVVWEITP